MLAIKKYTLYAQIKPYNLKISLVFSTDTRVRYVQEFVEDTMRSFRAKYKVGRIEQQKTKSRDAEMQQRKAAQKAPQKVALPGMDDEEDE